MQPQVLLFVLAGLIVAAELWQFRMSFPFDDAYITFRYAENVATGHGVVWNIGGPPTEGYTNFLLVLALTPFAFFHVDEMVISQIIGVVATILTAVVLFKFLASVGGPRTWAFGAAFLYLLLPYTWANAFNGLETSLFVLIVTSAFYFGIQEEWRGAFIFASLACLIRPEGALAGVILGASGIWTSQGRIERVLALRAMLLYLVLPMALYGAFKLFYFGNLLPNSFYIKTGSGFHGIQNLKQFTLGNMILLAVAAYGLVRHAGHWRRLAPIILWSLALVLFYTWPEPLQGFYDRFCWPAMPAIVALAALGVSREKWNVSSIVIFATLLGSQAIFSIPRMRTEMSLATNERGRQIYRELGTALHALPDHAHMTFAFQDAGAVPYFSEMKNIDFVGLNTTAIARAETTLQACAELESVPPEILLIPAYHDKGQCWTVFTAGHGKAGALIPQLIHRPLMGRYICAGRITYLGYDILCFVLPRYATEVTQELSSYTWFVPGPIPCLQ